MKTCTHCRVEKPLAAFPKIKRGYSSWCRECKNSDQLSRHYRQGNRFRRYGITEEQFEEMVAAGPCPICLHPYIREWGNRREPVLDHDHASGQLRGVTCRSCNLLLGFAQDSPALLAGAEIYLTEGPDESRTLMQMRNTHA